jgi:sec-independent protein translocase protein TatA
MDLGAPELLIILVIVLLLFGVGRISKIGGEVGNAVGSFRKNLDASSKQDTNKTDVNV